MILAHPFVYGRTQTIDYRWLQRPSLPLRIGFFGDALEACSPSLRKGNRAYFSAIEDSGCLLSVMLTLQEAEDQRGRKISFVLGYTVGANHARDFAYHLPTFLDSIDSLVARYLGPVLRSVETDSLVEIQPFDPLSIVLPDSGTSLQSYGQDAQFSKGRSADAVAEAYIAQASSFERPTMGARDSQIHTADEWIGKTVRTIQSSVNTPRVVCSFDVSGLGAVFERGAVGMSTGGVGVASLGSGSDQLQGSANERGDSAPLQQMRKFVGSVGVAKTNSGDGFVAKAYESTPTAESIEQESLPTQKTESPPSATQALIDLLFGKSRRPHGGSKEE